jgi:hypothetical protein
VALIAGLLPAVAAAVIGVGAVFVHVGRELEKTGGDG